ncbi:hypothetical protein NDU88_006224 [Pleurodeles waltl]|uniref:Uncharacterized protein n=1 Tax=Pleurodeles waltl TaxID=8319 RepID=A0AAV7L3H2_PLEWA|nr:hypothetical protein NDU88_006224 [Pleurodeles waltl]
MDVGPVRYSRVGGKGLSLGTVTGGPDAHGKCWEPRRPEGQFRHTSPRGTRGAPAPQAPKHPKWSLCSEYHTTACVSEWRLSQGALTRGATHTPSWATSGESHSACTARQVSEHVLWRVQYLSARNTHNCLRVCDAPPATSVHATATQLTQTEHQRTGYLNTCNSYTTDSVCPMPAGYLSTCNSYTTDPVCAMPSRLPQYVHQLQCAMLRRLPQYVQQLHNCLRVCNAQPATSVLATATQLTCVSNALPATSVRATATQLPQSVQCPFGYLSTATATQLTRCVQSRRLRQYVQQLHNCFKVCNAQPAT